ncbi:NADH-quinone oxidoreductase subunit N, partial [Acinetobacter baumannii]|uniref:NADH-quinone oxidoreductase subunit N n=1 Tax=Acinetobacter baumannii TaxID=470 RepID=UPI000AF0FD9C
MSIPIYFLIATNFLYQRRSIEGAIKYFIVGALGSLFFILALGIFYYLSGSLYFDTILTKVAQGDRREEFLAGIAFLLVGFSIKLSLVPFHMWAPDAYEASPIPVTAYLAGFIKVAVLSALIKVLILAFSPIKDDVGQLLLWVALLSILVGSVLAIIQENLIRLLAYSSIAHMGYAMLGLVSGQYVGYGFSIFYGFVYLFMTL